MFTAIVEHSLPVHLLNSGMAGQLLLSWSLKTFGGRAHKMLLARNGLSSDLAFAWRTPKNRAQEHPPDWIEMRIRLRHAKRMGVSSKILLLRPHAIPGQDNSLDEMSTFESKRKLTVSEPIICCQTLVVVEKYPRQESNLWPAL